MQAKMKGELYDFKTAEPLEDKSVSEPRTMEIASSLTEALRKELAASKKLDTKNDAIRGNIIGLRDAVDELIKQKNKESIPAIIDALSVLSKVEDKGLNPAQQFYGLSHWPDKQFLPLFLEVCENAKAPWRTRKAAGECLWQYAKVDAAVAGRIIGIYEAQAKEKGRDKMNAAAFYCLANMGALEENREKIGKMLQKLAGANTGRLDIAKALMNEGKVVLDPTNADGIGGSMDGWIKRKPASEVEWVK